MTFTPISSVLRQYYCFKISVINKRLLGGKVLQMLYL